MLKQKTIALILAITMIFTVAPSAVFAVSSEADVSWNGAMNFNNENNYVTSVTGLSAPNRTELKWAYPLNTSVISGGAYYAGQSVIVDGSLYATGGGKLHKVDIETGEGEVINEDAGVTVSYYDYLCYADGILILAMQNELCAYSLDGEKLGSVTGDYKEYHPVQYYDGYVFCNGYIYELIQDEDSVTFSMVGEGTIGGDVFNWSNGAFVNELFYVASKTTVYAVDYKTNTVMDKCIFDPDRTATMSVQGGLCYDAETKRLFWATYTYNSHLHSIEISEGGFVPDSYISEDVGQKSVATPIVYNGRVYLAGQQGRICVHNAADLSKVYDNVTLGGGKVQGNPILSYAGEKVRIYAQCSNGHLYMFTDNGEGGEAVKLADTKNYTKVTYPYAGFEQYAMDENGNIYCYNESGYLFCFGLSDCEKPTISKDLSTDRVKYGIGTHADTLSVEATVSDGVLSYQWQESADGDSFTDIDGAVEASYIPSTENAGITYYRCVITNTLGEYTASETSSSAYVLVKELSNKTDLNVMAAKGNSATATSNVAVAQKSDDGIFYIENCDFDVKNIFLGVADEGTVADVKVIYGAENAAPKKYSVSKNELYTERYYKSTYTKPTIALVTVTAEDGITQDEHYIIISEGTAGQYILKADITSDSEHFADNTISFTAEDQSAELKVEATETIGTGELYVPQWTWTSSDVKVATVDDTGTVKCIGGGTAVITASYEGVSTSVNVVSTASEHKYHSYVDGICTVCKHNEPDDINVFFTLLDKENNVAVSKDEETEIYKAEIAVCDVDCDGTLTLYDAFVAVHTEHSANGKDDFLAEESSYGPFITRLWGEDTSSVAYMHNDKSAYSLLTPIAENDTVAAYFYRDTVNYSDIYTYIKGNNKVVAGVDTEFTLCGLASSGEVMPKGASISVYGSEDEVVYETNADENGKFTVNIPESGEYIITASGNASYTGKVWDNAVGDYKNTEFESAPVVTSRFEVTVLPYVEKTVLVTVATRNGEFGKDKDGNDMWRIPVVACDDPASPDGVVTILEVLSATHKQYHADGISAFGMESSKYGAFITKLWGENNGGNCLYYFNDTEMVGSGAKVGTNGREWEDKLLDTVVENDDTFYIYNLQATDYKRSDLYTYFEDVSVSAETQKKVSFTLKSVAGYGNNVLGGSLVKVYDSKGNEMEELATTVADDGTFGIIFNKKGTYTVDVRTNEANFISPARCIVTVKSKSNTTSKDISVYLTVYTDKKHGAPAGKDDTHTKTKNSLELLLKKTKVSVPKGSTVIDVVGKVLDENGISYTFEGGYISEVNGLCEFDNGELSGWMFSVDGKYPTKSIEDYTVSSGDSIILHYTDDYTAERSKTGSGSSSSVISPSKDDNDEDTAKDPDKDEEKTETIVIPEFTKDTFKDISENDWYYNAAKYTYEKGLISGTEKGFEPDTKMTRAMLVTIVYRMAGSPEFAEAHNFTDVKKEDWYFDAVCWAHENGIVKGISETEFGSSDEVTREQALTILRRYFVALGIEGKINRGINAKDFDDHADISDYAKEAVEWAIDNAVIKGKGNNMLCPKDTLTRAEIAVILQRLCEDILK